MNKLEYFLHAIDEELYCERGWLISAFGIIAQDSKYFVIQEGKLFGNSGGSGLIPITGWVQGEPLYGRNEKVKLLKGTLRGMVKEDTETTYGVLIMNALMLYYPYRGAEGYLTGQISAGKLNNIALNRLKETKDVEAHIRFENAASMLTCLSQVGVPSATRRSIVPDERILKLRDKLLEENKDKLHDPAVVADIQAKLVKADKEENLKGDRSLGFFTKDKNFEVTRLRAMSMYGAEADFEDESKIHLMTPSLSEGWRVSDLPMLINTLRGGSFSRGAETALGGWETKSVGRVFQNYHIAGDDCGTTVGMLHKLNDYNHKLYVGRYLVGSNTPLTLDKLKSMIGKTVEFRDPSFCKSEGTTYCKRCMGDIVATNEIGLNAQAITVTSTFLSVFMSAMHGRALKVEKYNFKDRIN